MGILSFNGNKTITTGGGGAILTNDKSLAKKAKHLTTTARISNKFYYKHNQVGYNYRLPNLNAALGCAQLEQIKNMLKNKRKLNTLYMKAFNKLKYLYLFQEPKSCKSNYWLQTIILNPNLIKELDNILTGLNNKGIQSRPAWELMHKLDPFKKFSSMNLKNVESFYKRIINIPSSSKIIDLI